MKHVFYTAVLFIALTFLSACTRKLEVDVFIATKGGQNIKLGLVKINAIPYDDAVKALQPVLAARVAQRHAVAAAQKEANEKYTAIVANLTSDLETAEAYAAKAIEDAYAAMIKFKSAVTEAATAAEEYEKSIREKYNYDYSDPTYEKIRNELSPFPLKLSLAGFMPSKYPDGSEVESVTKVLEIINRKAWEGLPQHRSAVLEAAANIKPSIDAVIEAKENVKRLRSEIHEATMASYGPRSPNSTDRRIARCVTLLKTLRENKCRWTLHATPTRRTMDCYRLRSAKPSRR